MNKVLYWTGSCVNERIYGVVRSGWTGGVNIHVYTRTYKIRRTCLLTKIDVKSKKDAISNMRKNDFRILFFLQPKPFNTKMILKLSINRIIYK